MCGLGCKWGIAAPAVGTEVAVGRRDLGCNNSADAAIRPQRLDCYILLVGVATCTDRE